MCKEIASCSGSPLSLPSFRNRPLRGSPRWLRRQEGKRMAIDGTAVCAGSWTSASRHIWSVCSVYSVVPQSRPSPLAGRTRHRAKTPKESVAPCPRELTGENSPHLYRGGKTEKPHQQNATFLVFTLLVIWRIGFATLGWSVLLSSAGGSRCRSCNTVNTT